MNILIILLFRIFKGNNFLSLKRAICFTNNAAQEIFCLPALYLLTEPFLQGQDGLIVFVNIGNTFL